MINVTKSFVPPMSEYTAYLQRAFDKHWLTNRGELVCELETKLKTYLDVPFLTVTTNGTLPIQIAIKALELTGEIITTPFSYVATTSSIVWENCTPVFVDIDPVYWTIDEQIIELAITSRTSAILATHVFGNPCNVEIIEQIATKYNLKVIYDAAHCFGVTYKGKSIFNWGDVSTCSFHATKIFHTGEGGCWITNNQELQQKLYYHHNFGHDGPNNFHGIGINAKISELQAAMGLTVLDHFNEILEARKNCVLHYQNQLSGLNSIQLLKVRPKTTWNYHYFPIIFNSEKILLNVLDALKSNNIHARRYFYPSLNELNYVTKQHMPVSEKISKTVLCLPLSSYLTSSEIDYITDTIKAVL